VGSLKETDGMVDTGIIGKSFQKQKYRRSWFDTICLGGGT
jgi:hypothetical protein